MHHLYDAIMLLRRYQEQTLAWILERASAKPNARLLTVLPMGSGKSVIAAALLKLTVVDEGEPMRGLFVAHRQELLDNVRKSLSGLGITDNAVSTWSRDSNHQTPISLASVDALRRTPTNEWPDVDVVITDEAHRDAGIFRQHLNKSYINALRVGFTATPERLDGRSMRNQYDEMFVGAQPSELIAEGHIIAPRVYTVPAERLPDLSGVSVTNGEFNHDQLDRCVSTVPLLGDIVDHWQRRANNRRTIAFAVSRQHADSIAARFSAAGIAAEQINGNLGRIAREQALQRLTDGTTRVLVSVDLLGEGIDIPAVKCVIMARPTASLVVSNQQSGRCMRPWSADGEDSTALILDHAGNILRHGYPHADREWTLDGMRSRASGGKNQQRALRTCNACHAIIPVGAACPTCAKAAPATGDVDANVSIPLFIELPGDLVDLATAIPLAQREAEFRRLTEFAASRCFDSEWAHKVYKAKFHAHA